MSEQFQNESKEESLYTQSFCSSISSSISDSFVIGHKLSGGDCPDVKHIDRGARLNLAIDELRMGQSVHDELKRQGRSVSWLARQLCMERTSLYYTFRQSSINTELLLRISCCLEHNFFKDVSDAYEAFGL